MERSSFVNPPRPDLHARATRLARTLRARYAGAVPADALSLLKYWESCQRASARAAEQLLHYANVLGLPDEDASAAPSSGRSS
jgi:hypothetical protein